MDSNDLNFVLNIVVIASTFLGLGGLLMYALVELHKRRVTAETPEHGEEDDGDGGVIICQGPDWHASQHPWGRWLPVRSGSYLMQYRTCAGCGVLEVRNTNLKWDEWERIASEEQASDSTVTDNH